MATCVENLTQGLNFRSLMKSRAAAFFNRATKLRGFSSKIWNSDPESGFIHRWPCSFFHFSHSELVSKGLDFSLGYFWSDLVVCYVLRNYYGSMSTVYYTHHLVSIFGLTQSKWDGGTLKFKIRKWPRKVGIWEMRSENEIKSKMRQLGFSLVENFK